MFFLAVGVADVGTYAAFAILVVLGMVKLAQSFGYLKTEGQKEKEKLLTDIHDIMTDPIAKRELDERVRRIEEIHKILIDRVHQARQEEMYACVKSTSSGVDQLVRLHQPEDYSLPVWYCMCNKEGEIPCFKVLSEDVKKLNGKFESLGDLPSTFLQIRSMIAEWRESALVHNDAIIKVLTRVLSFIDDGEKR
jgi:hypothetical protein